MTLSTFELAHSIKQGLWPAFSQGIRLIALALVTVSVCASVEAQSVVTFEEGVNGTITSTNPLSTAQIFGFEEAGLTFSAINANPDHFHLFGDEIQIFGSDSSGVQITATNGGPFDIFSVDVVTAATPGQLVADTGAVFDITTTGTFSINFLGVNSVDWLFADTPVGDPSLELDNLVVSTSPVPEPGTAVSIFAGILILAASRRKHA